MAPARRPSPQASKRNRLELTSPLELPARAVGGFRSMIAGPAHPTTPAEEAAGSRVGTGLQPPEPGGATPAHLDRAFLFVDLSGFTAFVDREGEHAAIEVLTHFRSAARDVAARRGVRVGKWLGDGVMLVGTEPSVIAAAAGELRCRMAGSGFSIHAGLASGPVLLFEGDDYIGRPVNLAARLCDAAGPDEILAQLDGHDLPTWLAVDGTVTVHVLGMGKVPGISQLVVDADILADYLARSAA